MTAVPQGGRTEGQALLWRLCPAVVAEAALYSVLAPLLPRYVHTLHISTPAAGLLAAAYGAGVLVGSVAAGLCAGAPHLGVRRVAVGALMLMAASCVSFGAAHAIALLDVLRLLQGVAAGGVWFGALAWISRTATDEDRGSVLGTLMGAALFGTIIGPSFGAVANLIGPEAVFAAIGLLATIVAATLARVQPPASSGPHKTARPSRVLGAPGFGLAFWTVFISSAASAAIAVLMALKLSALGASGTFVGVTFSVAAVGSALAAPLLGRGVDRWGAWRVLRLGLAASAPLLIAMTVASSAWVLAPIFIVGVICVVAATEAPGIILIASSCKQAGLGSIAGSSVTTFSFTLGGIVSPPLATWLSSASSRSAPLLALAGLVALTLPGAFLVEEQRAPPVPRSETDGA
jgi:predicted MFS family arabinose efflux permease